MDLSTNSGDNHACRIRDARGDYTDGEWRGVHYLGDSGGTHATSHTLSQMRKDVQLAADLNNLEGHMYDIDMNPQTMRQSESSSSMRLRRWSGIHDVAMQHYEHWCIRITKLRSL